MRRATGTGTVERFGAQWRARLPDAKRTVLGVFPAPELAHAALDAYMVKSTAPRGDSLASYGPDWLDRRERSRPKSIKQDRDRWRAYVESWECYAWPMREIRRGDVRRWIDKLHAGLADQTARNALNLLRTCFQAALDDELIAVNPAAAIRIHPKGNVEDVWDYLRPDEQMALLRSPMPAARRALIGFAIGTGLRWSEQRMLELSDVHLEGEAPYVYIRRSAKGSTKNTRHRRVPLFGLGLAAARALVALAERRRNPRRLLCLPPRSEAYRGANGPRLDKALARAGVARHVRWHDLRHTCASSLVAGWWGRRWQLIEVRDFMGHRNISTTERYAHLAGSVVESAALDTRSHDGATDGLFPDTFPDGSGGFVNRRSGVQIPEVAPLLTSSSSGAEMAPRCFGCDATTGLKSGYCAACFDARGFNRPDRENMVVQSAATRAFTAASWPWVNTPLARAFRAAAWTWFRRAA